MSVIIKKIGYHGKYKATATIEIEEPVDHVIGVIKPSSKYISDDCFEYLLWYWGFTKGEKPSNHIFLSDKAMIPIKVPDCFNMACWIVKRIRKLCPHFSLCKRR